MARRRDTYFLGCGTCVHEVTDEAPRGRWKAKVVLRQAGDDEGVTGEGTASSARVAYREAVNDAFSRLPRGRRGR